MFTVYNVAKKDFSNIYTYASSPAGIFVMEVPDTLPPDARKRIILRQIATITVQSFVDTLVIIEPHQVRVRR